MDLIKQISSKGLVLDGAMSTALEKQGIDTNTDLWTAVALDKDLDKVYKVHMNYFQAGAQMAITDTYQQMCKLLKSTVILKTRLKK